MPDQRWIRSSLVWIVLIVALLAMWATFIGTDAAPTPRSIGQVAQEVRDGKVQTLVQSDGSREVRVKYAQEAGRRDAVTTIPAETDLLTVLKTYGVDPSSLPPGMIEFQPASSWGAWLSTLSFILPTLFLVGIFVFMMRQSQGSNNQAMSFGKSRARLFTAN
ncbi:MAG: cell division protein FtsH, partial [Thermomicrobiales bacterium]|nr:cell division protein FtsH [Thermomicrobiales bacterium]